MTLFLHIGTHKTGTTSIQQYCSANRQAMREGGLAYLTHGPKIPGANDLAVALVSDRLVHADFLLRLTNMAIKGFKGDRLVSAENFSLLKPNKFREVIAPHLIRKDEPIVIICYLRRQDEFVESLYLQRFRNGKINLPIEPFIKVKLQGSALDYEYLIQAWQNAFPEAEIRVRPYERARLARGDAVADFFETLGYPELYDPEKNQRGSNPRADRDVYELLRMLSHHTKFDVRSVNQALMAKPLPETGASKSLLSFADRKRIVAGYVESNERLRQAYLPQEDQLFAPLVESAETQSYTSFSQSQLQLLASVFQALHRAHTKPKPS